MGGGGGGEQGGGERWLSSVIRMCLLNIKDVILRELPKLLLELSGLCHHTKFERSQSENV